jgi:hypothetical protein
VIAFIKRYIDRQRKGAYKVFTEEAGKFECTDSKPKSRMSRGSIYLIEFPL